jgi:hypothetical protein
MLNDEYECWGVQNKNSKKLFGVLVLIKDLWTWTIASKEVNFVIY